MVYFALLIEFLQLIKYAFLLFETYFEANKIFLIHIFLFGHCQDASIIEKNSIEVLETILLTF